MELSVKESEIVQAVSEHFRLPVEKVYFKCRKRDIVEARNFLIIYFVLVLRHEINETTTHFAGLNRCGFYHGLTQMITNHKFNKQYRTRISSIFPINGTDFDDFWQKVLDKKQKLENERY